MNKNQKAQLILAQLKQLYPSVSPPLTHSNPFELLVAVILSAQCTDTMVNKVTHDLFRKYKTVTDYADANPRQFEKDIRSIGLYKNKTKNIIATAQVIHTRYSDEVPQTMEELTKLPGVGRKTANVVLWQAFGINSGIAVDTHVIRLAQNFRLTKHKDANRIEKDLMKLVPQQEWGDFTLRMILYGREYWPAHKKEDGGPVSNNL
jgi:endonuclease-3